MAEHSRIEWTDHSCNWWIGCTKASPGCANCYAERFGRRRGVLWGDDQPRHRCKTPAATLRRIHRRHPGDLVFHQSLGDFFDPAVPPLWRAYAWRLIHETPCLRHLILTKRPEHIASGLPPDWGRGWRSVWLGVTVEDQARAGRIRQLLQVPAAGYFISAEPLLGPLELQLAGVDHVIVGGESGPGARPCEVGWIRSLIEQCRAAGVGCFVKQLGARARQDSVELQLIDPKGGDPAEWPPGVEVRDFFSARMTA